jgi:hypothetical protein
MNNWMHYIKRSLRSTTTMQEIPYRGKRLVTKNHNTGNQIPILEVGMQKGMQGQDSKMVSRKAKEKTLLHNVEIPDSSRRLCPSGGNTSKRRQKRTERHSQKRSDTKIKMSTGREHPEELYNRANEAKVQQTADTPFMTGALQEDVGWVGIGPSVCMMLDGTYDPPQGGG